MCAESAYRCDRHRLTSRDHVCIIFAQIYDILKGSLTGNARGASALVGICCRYCDDWCFVMRLRPQYILVGVRLHLWNLDLGRVSFGGRFNFVSKDSRNVVDSFRVLSNTRMRGSVGAWDIVNGVYMGLQPVIDVCNRT
jgi:hypothetical protein